ncbi:hypothetical protein ABZV77_03895 [Streptomyces sp. NPDC004732]|uniref:hypothetical protein n=1 Tax=Streptomyces sp. NPDC004732 TaxID=3154290 RepID=UPI0033B496EA
MIKTCRECGEDTDEPIPVALEHVASTAGRLVYLCPVCTADLGILPLSQHPEGTGGHLVYLDSPAP